MRDRPVYFKELGDFLTTLRERLKWTQTHAVRVAHQRGLKAVTRQILLRMERGQIKDPDPVVLRELSGLYALPPTELLQRYIAEKYGRDLLGHSSDVPSGNEPVRDAVSSSDPTDPSSPEEHRRAGTAPVSLEHCFKEISQAAYAFEKFAHAGRQFAIDCEVWANRLTDLAAHYGIDLTRQPFAVHRPEPSAPDASGPEIRGQHHARGRRVRGASRKAG